MIGSGSTLGLVALGALVLPCVVIPLVPSLRERRLKSAHTWPRRIYIMVAIAVVLVMVTGVPLYIFAITMVLNLTIGRSETVPFSRFPMYAQPRAEGINIHIIDATTGAPVKTGIVFDVPPSSVLKLYRHELRTLGGTSSRIDPELAIERRAASNVAAGLLEAQRRAGRGDRAIDFRIELEVFSLEGRRIRSVRHLLVDHRRDAAPVS